ncbi:hypothetical protein MKO06_09420 [Gramella sp. GC03-9]|uniref:Uncharacterized protein n=1 Tax=Christiangramia oceanisediminis TaxID=2920386 RepID=A0A9X2KXK0_9FLAO|nr:hypothetical protein [Gramella oceanisediminis]MCP9200127.1 hypothetical protein [Gramella oceanisediminis]
MEFNKIEKLLERYDEGRTSVAEENLLREYFLKNEVPPHLSSYKLIFRYTSEQKDERLETQTKMGSSSRKIAWSSIAAIFIVAVGLYFFNESSQDLNQNDISSVSDEEMAIQKTKETLNMVSQLMNEGTADLVYLQEFNKTTNKILKTD